MIGDVLKAFLDGDIESAVAVMSLEHSEWMTHPDRATVELVILGDPHWAYEYAVKIMLDRWPEGEPAIATDPMWAYRYARYVIKGMWPEGEPAMASDSFYACLYARSVLKGRFPLGEPEIAKSYYNAGKYVELITPDMDPAKKWDIAITWMREHDPDNKRWRSW